MATSFFRPSSQGFPILTLLLLMQTSFLLPQNRQPLTEIELTPEFVASLEPKLSSSTLTGQLEILDKLTLGKGNILRIEGKSRRCRVLMLDSAGRQFVKLLDLSNYDLKDT